MSKFIQIIGQISRLRCASLEMTTKWIPVRHPTCSTIVEDPLQIGPFMQNKANFKKSQMNVRPLVIMNYERKSNWTPGENEPKTNPNKANFQIGRQTTEACPPSVWRASLYMKLFADIE